MAPANPSGPWPLPPTQDAHTHIEVAALEMASARPL